MQENSSEQEVRERLNLIERMITEGRRRTESWGWAFVLWGVAYYVAIAWSAWGQSAWAWPITILGAVMASVVVSVSKTGSHPETTLSRAIGTIWMALGISMFALFLPLGLSGRITDPHVFMAVMAAVLGLANGASALLLRWKMQLACAVVWWLTAAAVCFGSESQSMTVFLIAIFFCQIAFGVYGMITHMRERKQLIPSDVRSA